MGIVGLLFSQCGGTGAPVNTTSELAEAGAPGGSGGPSTEASAWERSGDAFGGDGSSSGLADGSEDTSSPIECPPGPPGTPACGASVCGNGVIDQCGGCVNQANCPFYHEECDGENLNNTSCTSLGYLGGSLACTRGCQFDQRGCTACASVGGPLLACRAACIGTGFTLALAATDQAAALSWISEDGPQMYFAHFAIFDRNLHVVAQATPWALPTTTRYDGDLLALAPSSSGWLLAVSRGAFMQNTGLTVYAFDASARPSGSPQFIAGGTTPSFGVRSGGSPLLGWTSASDGGGFVMRAALVADNASFQSAPADVLPAAEGGATAILGGSSGYLVAAVGPSTLATTHVGADGRPSGVTQQPLGSTPGDSPTLAPVSDQVALVFRSLQPTSGNATMEWAELDWNGAPLAAPVALSFPEPLPVFELLSAVADDWLVTAEPLAMKLRGIHIDGHGALVGAPYTIASVPSTNFRAARQGDRAVVAFTDSAASGSIFLAVVSLN
jgi:hypothetical protein